MLNSALKLILFFIFIPCFLFSGNNDSLKNSQKSFVTQYFNQNQFEYTDSAKSIESSISNFQNYFKRNSLGNSGLPFSSFYFNGKPNEFGFNYFNNHYQNYFFIPKTLNFYNTRTPYSELFYIIGSKAEQIFRMTFSYNVKKNWNISASFSRIRSGGFYLRQQTYDNFLSLSSNYKSTNNRYNFLAGVCYNSAKNDENGGISDDSTFINSGVDPKITSVNLDKAKRSTVNRSVFFNQYLNFGQKSTDTTTNNAIIPGSRLILKSSFEDNILKYEDESPQSDFYPTIFFDSTLTFDSTYNFKIENELSWKRVDNKKHSGLKDMLGASFGVKDQFVKVHQREIDTTFNNIIAVLEFYNLYSKNKFWWNISGKYGLTGFNANDYNASLILKKNILDSLNILFFKAEVNQQAPDFIFNQYSSNHYRWNNDFKKMEEKSISLNYSMKKYNFIVGAQFSTYTNILYFDNFAVPKQFQGSVPVFSAFLKKDFVFRNWHLDNKFNYQNVSDSTVIRLPKFILEHALYYESDLFKGAMRMQIGVSVFYNSAYFADSYMPATAQFYIQDNMKYGNYPFIDFFINARIKTVRVFIKIDHLNSGWMGKNYILTPHYPMNTRAFKLGVSWRFFD
ncbi:MAG: hypothetical protein A3F72_06090 [Bacteroidetes bacterium RIFCSPLOWO2_12_FULL_35_15]|nr:MAG: hypothetical protein A3F72_06090 [Bacteroidetes bacterium RIFCSPLOWO2_12_FULL_35_15]